MERAPRGGMVVSLIAMSTGRVSVRVRSIAPSATLAITAKAKELRAAGKPVIGFGAGEPDLQHRTTSSMLRSMLAGTQQHTNTPLLVVSLS